MGLVKTFSNPSNVQTQQRLVDGLLVFAEGSPAPEPGSLSTTPDSVLTPEIETASVDSLSLDESPFGLSASG